MDPDNIFFAEIQSWLAINQGRVDGLLTAKWPADDIRPLAAMALEYDALPLLMLIVVWEDGSFEVTRAHADEDAPPQITHEGKFSDSALVGELLSSVLLD